MKKKWLVMSCMLVLLPFMAVLLGNTSAAAEDKLQQVVIHKKAFADGTNLKQIQNTGEEMDAFKDVIGIQGVQYVIYDISEDFYAKSNASDSSVEEISKGYSGIAVSAKSGVSVPSKADDFDVPAAASSYLNDTTFVTTGVTGAADSTDNPAALGDATFHLPKLTSDNKHAVYLILELPKAGYSHASNIVLGLPVMDPEDEETELATINLYPKSTITDPGTLHVRKQSETTGEALNGAEFLIKRNADNKYITGAEDGIYTIGSLEHAFHFVTGNSYTPGDAEIAAGSASQGVLDVQNLSPRTYTLIEVEPTYRSDAARDVTKDMALFAGELINGENNKQFTVVNGGATDGEGTVITSAKPLLIKNDTTEVSKTASQTSYDVGEAIPYTISVNIPEGINDKNEDGSQRYQKFAIEDAYDHALTLRTTNEQGAATLADGKLVMTEADGTETPIPYVLDQQTKPEHVVVGDDQSYFTIDVPEIALQDLKPGAQLTLTYTMVLNEEAKPGVAYKNTANGNNGHTWMPKPPTVDVLTGGMKFKKVDGDSNKGLPGAKFVVVNTEGRYLKVTEANGALTTAAWVADKAAATTYTSGKDGAFEVTGLAAGEYQLEETAAPAGYAALRDNQSFTVTTGKKENNYSDNSYRLAAKKIVNVHKGILPSTGGAGILLFAVVGGLLIVGALFYFVYRRKQV